MALDSIYQTLEGQIVGTLGGAYSSVMGLVSGPLQTAMAINLIIVGFAIMRGVSNEPFGNYLGTWLKCYLVIAAATSSIAPQIAAAAQQAPDMLASALGGQLSASFDQFITSSVDPAKAIHNSMPPWELEIFYQEYSFPNPITGFMLILMIIAAYLIAIVAMVMVLFVKFGLYITVAVFPIFVAALIFPSSSGLFFSWLGAILNYAIQTAAVALIFVFVVSVIGNIPGQVSPGGIDGNTWRAVESMVLQIATIAVGGFLIMQVQSIASFAGGGGSSGGGLLSAVYPRRLINKIHDGGLKMGGRGIGGAMKMGGRGAASAGSAMKTGAARLGNSVRNMSSRPTQLTGASSGSGKK